MKKKLIGLIPIGLMLVLSISGCVEEESEELQEVTVRLKWLHQAQFAGNYVANEKGFYEKYGMEITELLPFDFVNWPIDKVENKEVDFGITGGDELVLAKVLGKADHIKAIAVIFKTNPVCLYSLKESGITKPQDFVGKTVGIERAADGKDINVGILYKAMMAKLGINRSDVNEITIGYDATELLAGTTDVSSGYVINEPHQAIEAGKEVDIILVADYGVNMYADVIIVHEDTINNSPELVESFLRATLEGWQYAIEHEEEAVNITLKYATDRTKSHETYMLENSIPLINTGDSPIGWMEESKWEQVQDILLEQNITDAEINIEDVYTIDFLEKIYGET
ncbi:MAG: ABC transporter substrate-binding protein [Candidatus Heimdallarchaeota archaeon]|nr:ABC transporter substrate-binding protein [Candidatus Heimdallarchaeota archaeon]